MLIAINHKFPTKCTFRNFRSLKIYKMMQICDLFMEQPLYIKK